MYEDVLAKVSSTCIDAVFKSNIKFLAMNLCEFSFENSLNGTH